MNLFDPIYRFLGLFDSNGLKYSVNDLKSIRKEIAFYPLKKQAKYADKICVEHVNDLNFLMSLDAIDPYDITVMQTLNTTSIGNAAYICLNCKYESYRKHAAKVLEMYKKHINWGLIKF